jgi:methylenetetrahydrofolate dehydrogenase (NADP+)/methenyltetrahydrofolate cyclohydrolase
MAAGIIDGRAIAQQVRAEVAGEVAAWVAEGHEPPGLATVLVGDDAASAVYVGGKQRASAEVGIEGFDHRLPQDTGHDEVERLLLELNEDPRVSGILLQLPTPPQVDGSALTELIDPAKDVDGATPTNAGWLARGEPAFVPATALAVIAILEAYEVPVAGRRAVIIGRSAVVGRPVASLFVARDATTVICHRATHNLARETRRAEILVSAAGVAGLVRPEMVNRSAVVIDCGSNAVPGGVVGDVEFAAVAPVVSAISPVPGGVGPVTPMMVLRQTVESAELAAPERTSGAIISSIGTDPSMNPRDRIVS